MTDFCKTEVVKVGEDKLAVIDTQTGLRLPRNQELDYLSAGGNETRVAERNDQMDTPPPR